MLTEWLEESYNSEAEIQEMIDAAPDAGDPNQRRIYLDLDSGVNLTRTELLEVSRSLYPGVLQKLASILTHLKVFIPRRHLTGAKYIMSDCRKGRQATPVSTKHSSLAHAF